MVIILPRHETAAGRVGRAAGEGFTSGVKEGSEKREKSQQRAFEEAMNVKKEKHDLAKMLRQSEIDKDMAIQKFNDQYELQNQTQLNAMKLQGFKKEQENKIKQQENIAKKQEKILPLQGAMQTIEDMRSIKNKGNLGRGSSVLGMFNEDVRKDRSEYSQLGKSLISFASTIPIRNKAEFEVLAHDLYDPSKSEGEIDGILNAMEKIIHRSMESEALGKEEEEGQEGEKELDADAMQKIRRLANGDKEKAKKIAKKMGYRI
jgi:hypothetical protein